MNNMLVPLNLIYDMLLQMVKTLPSEPEEQHASTDGQDAPPSPPNFTNNVLLWMVSIPPLKHKVTPNHP